MDGAAGIATFLFTDIEGSTRLWDDAPDRMRAALAEHDRLCRGLVQQHRGEVVSSTGDGFFAVFADPLEALHTVIEFQRRLREVEARVAKERIPDAAASLRSFARQIRNGDGDLVGVELLQERGKRCDLRIAP